MSITAKLLGGEFSKELKEKKPQEMLFISNFNRYYRKILKNDIDIVHLNMFFFFFFHSQGIKRCFLLMIS